MEYFLGEMTRLGLNLPVMIGGATTSKEHTAIKLYPKYKQHCVFYTSNASRAVTVCATLMNPEGRAALWEQFKRITRKSNNLLQIVNRYVNSLALKKHVMALVVNGQITCHQRQNKRALWNLKRTDCRTA